MTGLRPDWASVPRRRIETVTTSASGPARRDICEAIPLADALLKPPEHALLVKSADGASLLLPGRDVPDAYLAPLASGEGWQLILRGDTTRRRRLKHPCAFISS